MPTGREVEKQLNLSLEELMDLAEKQLDAIDAEQAFADTTTWLAVMSFVERVQRISTSPRPDETL